MVVAVAVAVGVAVEVGIAVRCGAKRRACELRAEPAVEEVNWLAVDG